MNKRNIKFLIPITVILIVLTILRFSEPEEVDWTESFSKEDKVPYGGYIIHNIASELFNNREIRVTEFPIYNILKEKFFTGTNYVFINSYFSPDVLDTEYLLHYVSKGNQVFISAYSISGNLADSLNFITHSTFFNNDSTGVNFNLPNVKSDKDYIFKKGNFENYFSSYDTSLVQVLGKNDDGNVNFIRIRYGNGNFLLNVVPLAFTNFNMLYSGNQEYVYKALSHLPVQRTMWDDYYKVGNIYSVSALQYILSKHSLRMAYYLLIASVVLFIFFYAKRKQRVIPVIDPLKNTSLEFVRTVSNLYYQQRDYKNIAEKKISYFLDYIRQRYFIKTGSFDENTLLTISEKSSIPLGKIKAVFSQIERIKSSNKISDEELLNINHQIEKFYERTK